MRALQRIYITKICKAYSDDRKEFPPLKECKFDEIKQRWYTESHSIEELILKFKDCIVSAPGGELEYGNSTYKRFKDDWVVVIYNNFFEI